MEIEMFKLYYADGGEYATRIQNTMLHNTNPTSKPWPLPNPYGIVAIVQDHPYRQYELLINNDYYVWDKLSFWRKADYFQVVLYTQEQGLFKYENGNFLIKDGEFWRDACYGEAQRITAKSGLVLFGTTVDEQTLAEISKKARADFRTLREGGNLEHIPAHRIKRMGGL